MLLKETSIPILINSFEFKIKLHNEIDPENIPTHISDQEATLCLYIRGLKPRCFACGKRGHLATECKEKNQEGEKNKLQTQNEEIDKTAKILLDKDFPKLNENNIQTNKNIKAVTEESHSSEPTNSKMPKNIENEINQIQTSKHKGETINNEIFKITMEEKEMDVSDGQAEHTITNKTATEIMDKITQVVQIIDNTQPESKRKQQNERKKRESKKIKTNEQEISKLQTTGKSSEEVIEMEINNICSEVPVNDNMRALQGDTN